MQYTCTLQDTVRETAMKSFKALWKRSSDKGDKQAVSGTEEYFFVAAMETASMSESMCMLYVCLTNF